MKKYSGGKWKRRSGKQEWGGEGKFSARGKQDGGGGKQDGGSS